MAVDFTNPHLKPRIHSDRCSLDDYSIQNLISSNPAERNLGFMCERFVSPPVVVTVSFPCQIELQKIVIDPCVGNQKSCGFQIFTQSEEVRSWLLDNAAETDDVEVIDLTSEMQSIAKRYVRHCDGHPVFVFTNGYFNERRPYIDQAMARKVFNFQNGKEITSDLRHRERQFTSNVSHVIIKITGTTDGTIPCMKQLAVYGQPSRNCPRNVSERVLSILKALRETPVSDQPTVSLVSPVRVRNENESVESESTPSEYLDEITFELMSMPMLLPSGHNVDQRTLDRFAAEEAVWGRVAADPFTGLAFIVGTRPVVNTALKARIEQYIVKERIDNVGRTTGRSETNSRTVSVLNHDSSNINSTAKKRKRDEILDSCAKIRTRPCGIARRNDDSQPSTSSESSRRGNSVGHEFSLTNSHRRKNVSNHDENLQASLDDALGATLRNLPSFTSSPKQDLSSTCSECSTNLAAHRTYSIPCGHLICNDCVKKCRKCPTCAHEFSSQHIIKVNL